MSQVENEEKNIFYDPSFFMPPSLVSQKRRLMVDLLLYIFFQNRGFESFNFNIPMQF